jgi:hypothetical protein
MSPLESAIKYFNFQINSFSLIFLQNISPSFQAFKVGPLPKNAKMWAILKRKKFLDRNIKETILRKKNYVKEQGLEVITG